MRRYEEYIETTEYPGNTHLNVSIYYDKGGPNYFSGGMNRRGYYISVTPVSKSNGMVRFTAFQGIKDFISETSRYSDRQFEHAIESGKAKAPELIEYLRNKQKAKSA